MRAIAEHKTIVDAIFSHDGVAAEAAARRHIQSTIDDLRALATAAASAQNPLVTKLS